MEATSAISTVPTPQIQLETPTESVTAVPTPNPLPEFTLSQGMELFRDFGDDR
jgi:hypothetical protein